MAVRADPETHRGSPDRMLKKCRSHGLPDRKAGNASACARLAHPGRGHRPPDQRHQTTGPAEIIETSARPGGREAPALGRGGRCPGALAPGWPRINVALWQGRWPLPMQQGWWFGLCSSAPFRAGPRNALRFPRPRAALPPRPVLPAPREVSARRWRVYRRVGRGPRAFWPPAGRGQPGAVAGAMAPARTREGAQAEEFPAFRSGSPCGGHVSAPW